MSTRRLANVRGIGTHLWRRLRGGDLTPWRAGGSVGVGLFVGSLPVYGGHFPLCLALCLPLRLDVLVAYLAACFNNPFSAPLLLTVEVEIGSLLLTGELTGFDLARARDVGLAGFFWDAAVGSLIVGFVLAVAGAVMAFLITGTRTPRARDDVDRAVERTARRYAGARPRDRYYVLAKLRGDPVARQLTKLGDLGDVVDVGCGRGQLALLLAESGQAKSVVGLDWDARKIATAESAGATRHPPSSATLSFRVEDVRAAAIPEANTVLLIDVLHYLSQEEQEVLLERACAAVRGGGRLIVREADARRTWRAMATRLPERIGVALGFNRGSRICMRTVEEIVRFIEVRGLACTTDSLSEGVPLANTLIVARAT